MTEGIDAIIAGRPRDLGGGFHVARVLPAPTHRAVGPFVFFDHMGPVELPPGEGLDVRPHPHIGLATVTYLFEGAIRHRDSIGSDAVIEPGAINWMTAGRGIAHSERTPQDVRARGHRVHGLQLWVALPLEHEEAEPAFHHYAAETLPVVARAGVNLRVLAGAAYGARSPVAVLSPLFYVEASLRQGASLPPPAEHEQRAVYVVEGAIRCGGAAVGEKTMILLTPGSEPAIEAEAPARVMILGGAPLDSPRHIWWNLVSSSEARIEKAKAEWRDESFPKGVGDAIERIPLPE